MNELQDLLAAAPPRPIFGTTTITEAGQVPREAAAPPFRFDAVRAMLDCYGFECVLQRAAIFRRLNPGATYAEFSRAMFREWSRR